jgi:two-component system nitrogen regulation sensor histidine kinase NtrY
MTEQIERQTAALVRANMQIDERRALMEAVLESVTAGLSRWMRRGRSA